MYVVRLAKPQEDMRAPGYEDTKIQISKTDLSCSLCSSFCSSTKKKKLKSSKKENNLNHKLSCIRKNTTGTICIYIL